MPAPVLLQLPAGMEQGESSIYSNLPINSSPSLPQIKAECPLCKQGFKSIIHNVKSEREFEEYLVQPPLQYNLMLSEPFRFSYSTTLQVRPSQSEALQRLFLHHPSLTDRYVAYPRPETPNVRRRIYDRGLYALPLFDITGRARECSAAFYR